MMKNIHYSSNPNGRKGFVLSLILWIVAGMMLLVLLYVKLTKEESQMFEKLQYKMQTELATQSLFELLSFYIVSSEFHSTFVKNSLKGLPKILKLDRSEYNITINNTQCKFSLFDHSGLYNLHFLVTPNEAQNTIEIITNKKYFLKDIYIDWIDKGDNARLNGAERNDYLLNGYAYIPENYNSFQTSQDLFLLMNFNNFTDKEKLKISKYFTTYGTVPINVLLLDKIELKSFFPNFEEDEIENLIRIKDENSRNYYKEFQKTGLTQNKYSLIVSKVITLTIKCKYKDVLSSFSAVVDFKPTNNQSWSILEIKK